MAGKKKSSWVKTRHAIIMNLAKLVLVPMCKIKYHIDMVKCHDRRQMLIVFNHVTAYDQFFVAESLRLPIYFIASEDIFSMGFLSKLLRWAVAPIPIKKQAKDVTAVKTAIKVVKEGGSIALSPEGNRTYSGKLCHIKATIAPMARKFKLPIACYRIEGGYGVQPRWSNDVRKGTMKSYVSRIIEPEEYAEMTDDELMAAIVAEINVDERNIVGEYHSNTLAEYMERAIYVCPDCGLSRFESRGDIIKCLKCNKGMRYLPNKHFEGVGFDSPFEQVLDWYEYQENYVNKLDLVSREDEVIYEEKADLYKVNLYKNKELLESGIGIELKGGGIVFIHNDGRREEIPFADASAITVLGRNLLDIYCSDAVYQLKSDERFNALKFVHFYNRWNNIKKGYSNEQFLGL